MLILNSRFLYLSFIFFAAPYRLISYAQNLYLENDTLVVNKELLSHIQLLDPSFAYTDDSEELSKRLKKAFLNDYAFYRLNKDKIIKDTTLMSELKRFLRLCEVVYLARSYQRRHLYRPSEDQIRAHYEVNKIKYSSPPIISFYQLWFPESADPKLLDEGRKILIKRLKDLESGNPDFGKMMVAGSGALNHESNIELNPSHTFYPYLSESEKGKVLGPFDIGRSKVFFAITDKKGGEVLDYQAAKNYCINELISLHEIEKEKLINEELSNIKLIIKIHESLDDPSK